MDVNAIATKKDIDNVLRRLDELEKKVEQSVQPKQKEQPAFPKLLKLKEVIAITNFCENTIKKKVKKGEIIRIETYPGNWRYPSDQFNDTILKKLNKTV